MSKLRSDTYDKVNKLIHSMGCEFWGGEISSQNGSRLYRLYIDAPQGVTIDRCAEVSRQIAAMLEVEKPADERYTIEVSSPGINRQFYELTQFAAYVNSPIVVRLLVPIEERRRLQGTLVRVDLENRTICMTVDVLGDITLPYANVEKANLVGEVSFKKTVREAQK